MGAEFKSAIGALRMILGAHLARRWKEPPRRALFLLPLQAGASPGEGQVDHGGEGRRFDCLGTGRATA